MHSLLLETTSVYPNLEWRACLRIKTVDVQGFLACTLYCIVNAEFGMAHVSKTMDVQNSDFIMQG